MTPCGIAYTLNWSRIFVAINSSMREISKQLTGNCMHCIGCQHQLLKSSLESHQFVFLMGLSHGCLSCRRNARARQRSCNSPTEQLPPPSSTLVFLRVQSNWPGKTQRPAVFSVLLWSSYKDLRGCTKQNSNFELFTSLLGCFTVFRFSQNLRGATKTHHFVTDVTCLSGPLSAT